MDYSPKSKSFKNFRIVISLLSLISLSTALTNCGENQGNGSSSFESQMLGIWENSCDGNGSFDQGSELRTWKFSSGSSFVYTVIQYSDESCTSGNETIVLSGSGSYTLSQNESAETIRNISFAYSKFSAILKDQDVVSEFKQSEICDISTWLIDTPVDLFGKTCKHSEGDEVIPGPTEEIKDLIDVAGERMWFGNKKNPLEPKAPTDIDSSVSYSKS